MRRCMMFLVLAGLIALPAQASAAVTIGQAPPSAGGSSVCSPNAEYLQGSVASGTIYTAPSAGVVTSWRTFSGPADADDVLQFRVYRPVGAPGTYTPTSGSPSQALGPDGTLNSFPTRQSIAAGDVIGLYVVDDGPNNFSACVYGPTGLGGDVLYALNPAAAIGSPSAYPAGGMYRVDVAAVVEADADGDGYGDESQDLCPSNAAVHDQCPGGPSDTDPPQTTIDKGAPKLLKAKKVKISFSSDEAGSTFTCRLDKEAEKACSSPKKLKGLSPGKHKFSVFATDAAGNPDKSSAINKFKVKRG